MLKGYVGELAAQLEFAKHGYEIYSPPFGNTTFDFMVFKDGIIETVEVKSTSQRTRNGKSWEVTLKSTRSNKTSNTIRPFDNTKMDYLVVYVEQENRCIIYRASDVKSTSTMVIPLQI